MCCCRMYTYAVPCCFKAPVRKEGQRIVTRFQLQDDIEQEICSNDPWIILHKIDSPTKMRYIGSKVNSCNKTLDSSAVAPSIAAWVKEKGKHISLVYMSGPCTGNRKAPGYLAAADFIVQVNNHCCL